MTAGDKILINGKLWATVHAIRTRDQLRREVSPLVSDDLYRRLSDPETISGAVVVLDGYHNDAALLIETAAGWTSADGEFLSVAARRD